MDLTVSSVLNTYLFHSLLIFLLCIFFKQDKVARRIGPDCMIIILLVVTVRLFVPFEFSYTKSIWVEDILTPSYSILIYPILLQSFNIKVWHILLFIWGIGSAWLLLHKIYIYRKTVRFVSLLPEQQWDVFIQKYGLDREKLAGIEGVGLAICGHFRSPCLVGFRHPCLILPKIPYNKEQLHYIVLHELMHIRKKDIAWKILIDMLCAIFWWNPIFRYLKGELFQLIEMRNDMGIIAEISEEEKIIYMECLADIALQMTGKELDFGLSFNGSGFKGLIRRIDLISEGRHFCHWQRISLGVMTGILLFLSSAIIIEPFTYKGVDEGVPLTSKDIFLIINGDEYDVYVYGHYAMTVDDLNLFQDIAVYSEIGEVRKDE